MERGGATCRHATPRGAAACASSTASSSHPKSAATAAATAPPHAPRAMATSAARRATRTSTAWAAARTTDSRCTRHLWPVQLLAAAPITRSAATLYLAEVRRIEVGRRKAGMEQGRGEWRREAGVVEGGSVAEGHEEKGTQGGRRGDGW